MACQDTDVFCLLIARIDKMRCKQLWMKAGTSKKPKYLPIHTIRERMKSSVSKIETILSFYAITGCDTVSFFAGHSKKTAWKAFAYLQKLLESLGDGDLDGTIVKSVENLFLECTMLLMQRVVMKHLQRCFLGTTDPQRHFPQQVMQHDGISLGRTFKQWYGD